MNDIRALDQMLRPYFEGHWKNELEKAKLDTDFESKVLETEFKFRKWMMIGTFAAVFIILILVFYLFATNRDSHAMQLVVGIVLVVMTFIAGRGRRAPTRNSSMSDE